MKAYIYDANPDGTDKIGSGRITSTYRSYTAMLRYYIRTKLRPGIYNVHIHDNWDTRYKTADCIRHITIP